MPPTAIRPDELLPLPGGTGRENVVRLMAALRLRLGDEEPDSRTAASPRPLLPHEPTAPAGPVLTEISERARVPLPEGTVAVLRSSGSTSGRGHLIAVTAEALRAGARAGEQALGGPGRWVLALPTHHIAGFQILVRSVVGATEPVLVDTSGGFHPHRLAEAITQAARGARAYVSLVPTQLHRVLQSGPAVLGAMRQASAVLVGGAATAPSLQQAARAAGLPLVTSYGMTETCGGCAYDGLPLEGMRVRIMTGHASGAPHPPSHDEEPVPGRVEISGPMLAAGYLDQPAETVDGRAASGSGFRLDDAGTRWLQTSDLGVIRDGRLQIVGRVDDVINTGGVKVSPGPVEDLLGAMEGVAEAMVVGIPDARWGQSVVAVVVPTAPDRPPSLPELRAEVIRRLGPPHAPRALVTTTELPTLGPGKRDRRAAARLAAQHISEEEGTDGHGH